MESGGIDDARRRVHTLRLPPTHGIGQSATVGSHEGVVRVGADIGHVGRVDVMTVASQRERIVALGRSRQHANSRRLHVRRPEGEPDRVVGEKLCASIEGPQVGHSCVRQSGERSLRARRRPVESGAC